MTSIGPESWHEGEARLPSFGQLNAYRVSQDLDAFLGIDHEGRRHLLLGFGGGSEQLVDDRSRGLLVSTRSLQVETLPERRFVDVRCADPTGYEAFNVVVSSIL